MSTATITFTDSSDGNVDIRVDFGDGTDDSSGAHHMAVKAMNLLVQDQKRHPDEYED